MDLYLALIKKIPDATTLVALEPDQLGMELLLLWQRLSPHEHVQPSTFNPERRTNPLEPQFPSNLKGELSLAFSESFNWLIVRGLAAPVLREGNLIQLTRRGLKIKTQQDFLNFKIASLLPREILSDKIAEPVWNAFLRSEFDIAAFRAMKAVEVSVRDAARLAAGDIGTKLMRKAFGPGGPLVDPSYGPGEQAGRADLFAGAIACYKNAQSHREVNLDNPAEALEIVLIANHLLRIVEAGQK